MTITKTLAAAAAATMIAGSAMAGGFAAAETEEVVIIPAPAAVTGSLPGWVIPAVIVAALVGVAVAGDDS